MCEVPTEYVLYNNNKFNVYIDGELTNTIELKDELATDSNLPWLFPLPNNRFIFKYENWNNYKIAIGNYENKSLLLKDIELQDIPPVVDGTFTFKNNYYEILPNNEIKVTELKTFGYDTIIPANIMKTNKINKLLVVEGNIVRIYNTNKRVQLINGNILAWFDNKYILTADEKKLIIYDITKEYDMKEDILKLKSPFLINQRTGFVDIPEVVHLINISNLGLYDINHYYVRTASDDSIDVFIADIFSRIIVLHIDNNRDLSVENYPFKEHNIVDISNIIGDEFGIAIYGSVDGIWFYINRTTRSISKLGKGVALTFSNERYKSNQRKLIKSLEIPGLLTNVQGIIGEYAI